jgi:hypothetical protein
MLGIMPPININNKESTMNNLINYLNALHRGIETTVEYRRPADVLKRQIGDNIIEKWSRFQMRFGIAYGNQEIVKEQHLSGEVEKLGLGKWEENVINPDGTVDKIVTRNKDNGQLYLNGGPTYNKHSVHEAKWFLNGKEVAYEEVEPFLSAREKAEKKTTWLKVRPELVLSINGIPVNQL